VIPCCSGHDEPYRWLAESARVLPNESPQLSSAQDSAVFARHFGVLPILPCFELTAAAHLARN
jgi:hypothetical protein